MSNAAINLNEVNESEGFKVGGKVFESLDRAVSAAKSASKDRGVHVLGWSPTEQNWVSVGLCDNGELMD